MSDEVLPQQQANEIVELRRQVARLRCYEVALDSQPWASDDPVRVQLDSITKRLQQQERQIASALCALEKKASEFGYLVGVFEFLCREADVPATPEDEQPRALLTYLIETRQRAENAEARCREYQATLDRGSGF